MPAMNVAGYIVCHLAAECSDAWLLMHSCDIHHWTTCCNIARRLTYEAPYEEQQEADDPTRSFEGLHRLLAFADAVGSTTPALLACNFEGMQLKAQLGQQQVVLESPSVAYYLPVADNRLFHIVGFSNSGACISESSTKPPEEKRAEFVQQVAAQTEQLLWLAYRLQLQPLVQHLHTFIRSSAMFSSSLLRNQLDAVFSQRVLEAADISSLSSGKQQWVDSILSETISFASEPLLQTDTTLKPEGLSVSQMSPMSFTATVVTGSVMSKPPDSRVEIELDLFRRGVIRIGRHFHPVQLRIGPQYKSQQ
jgi:hypothetical protein